MKTYTDLEQSKKLAEILPIESADTHYMKNKLPLWKKILYKILSPFVFCWFGLCWCIMKVGRFIYWFGNKLSGDRIDPYNWKQEI